MSLTPGPGFVHSTFFPGPFSSFFPLPQVSQATGNNNEQNPCLHNPLRWCRLASIFLFEGGKLEQLGAQWACTQARRAQQGSLSVRPKMCEALLGSTLRSGKDPSLEAQALYARLSSPPKGPSQACKPR